ncbi:4Fe-4S ferredoxin [Kosmotoga arenicorallina S304]|uniref:4Fe-4S ferredoxin n=1 Tax=Kosmotoga arenicorallina S304 TaxID=1453497 RepID=A0A176K0X3_9BACT|nr:4Fe-4S binding protein [Kosmotoga arenicorallina]OAA30046.1 4Fe-4S ferredoxin [Kosmotoga arenicorallina S304]
MKNKSLTLLRLSLEILALLLFLFFLKNRTLQLWLIVFGASVLGSFLFGRFYCGLICPMETLFRPINWIYAKLKIKRFKTPKIFKNNVVRWGILALFLFLMVATKAFHLKINILLYITVLSIVITLIFDEEFWHKYLCPFGAILALSSRRSFFGLNIDKDNCALCNICQSKCPINVISKENSQMKIDTKECLLCFECAKSCPKISIRYTKLRKTNE